MVQSTTIHSIIVQRGSRIGLGLKMGETTMSLGDHVQGTMCTTVICIKIRKLLYKNTSNNGKGIYATIFDCRKKLKISK